MQETGRFPAIQSAVTCCSHCDYASKHGPPSSLLRITGLWLVWHFHDLISPLLRAHSFRTADHAAVSILTCTTSSNHAGNPQDKFLVVRLHPGERIPKGSAEIAKQRRRESGRGGEGGEGGGAGRGRGGRRDGEGRGGVGEGGEAEGREKGERRSGDNEGLGMEEEGRRDSRKGENGVGGKPGQAVHRGLGRAVEPTQ